MPVGNYSREEIRRWVKEEPESELLDMGKTLLTEELDHVVHCLESIVSWYQGKIHSFDLDPFLVAVLTNNFMRACGEADNINVKVLPIYSKFLYNNLPSDYKDKVRKEFRSRKS